MRLNYACLRRSKLGDRGVSPDFFTSSSPC